MAWETLSITSWMATGPRRAAFSASGSSESAPARIRQPRSVLTALPRLPELERDPPTIYRPGHPPGDAQRLTGRLRQGVPRVCKGAKGRKPVCQGRVRLPQPIEQRFRIAFQGLVI